MNALCCIPARGGSKRLPGKNIMPILGRPLISYAISHAKAATLVNMVAVSTDDGDIAKVAAAEGARVVMRPPELSTDTSAIEDAIRHTIRALLEEDGYETDIVVLAQANIIYRQPGLIDNVIQKLIDTPNMTAIMSCYEVNQRPEWMKKIENGVLIPNINCEKFRQQDLPKLYLADGSATAIRAGVVMKTEGLTGVHKFCGDAIGPFIQDRMFAVEVDHPDDVLAAETLLRIVEKKA